jgi:CelD/BcsL family acetyltransferase involved in cellulose biosynthesis/ribosomal protein S18 acetylase RimI-like enzyme
LPAAAAVFARTFDASVWARMGAHSAEAYLAAWLKDPREFMVLAEDPRHGIVGGLLATHRKDSHRGPVLRQGAPSFGPALARDVLQRPAAAVAMGSRMVSGLAATVQRRISPPPPDPVEWFEPQWPREPDALGYVAAYWVAPEARGQRLATRMCRHAQDTFAAQGLRWCDVATYTDNIASQTTALRADFRLVRQEGTHLAYRTFIGEGAPGDFALRVTDSPLDDPELPGIWDALLAQTPDGSGFHTWAWRRALLTENPDAIVAIVTLAGTPVALFPMAFDRESGALRFFGTRRSNYSGPLYDPAHMPSVLGGLRALVRQLGATYVDLEGLREHSPFRRAARGLVLDGLGLPQASRTIACSEIDLRPGWDAVWRRRKKKHRNNWSRARRKLEQLGTVEFEDITGPAAIDAVMGDAVRLYETRWAGANVDRAFGREREVFQRTVARALAERGQAVMSVLRVEDEIIAFSYAVRHGGVSNSYTLAHDDSYAPYSPGQLLLLHVLEQAAGRGDPSFDFSVGDELYKEVWATARIGVYRLAWGRGAVARTTTDRMLAMAREQRVLRQVKQYGVMSLRPAADPVPQTWAVQRVPTQDSSLTVRTLNLTDMRALVPPELFALAIDRVFRGDQTCVVLGSQGPQAIVWKAAASRREGLCRGAASGEVFFDIRPLQGASVHAVVAALGPSTLVHAPIQGLEQVRSFEAPAPLVPARA